MRKILSSLFVIIILITLIPIVVFASGDETKYDFTTAGELSNWIVAGGTWKISDGLLSQSSATPGSWNMHLGLKDKKFKDFTIKVRMKVDKENLGMGWGGIFFRKDKPEDTQEQSGYGLTLQGKNGSGKIVFVDWAHGSKSWEENAIKSKAGEWNELVLTASGNSLALYLNDNIKSKVPNVSITDIDNGWLNEGFISVAAGNAKVSYDYIYIYTGDKQSLAFSSGNTVSSTSSSSGNTVSSTVPSSIGTVNSQKQISTASNPSSGIDSGTSVSSLVKSQSISSELTSKANIITDISSDTNSVSSQTVTTPKTKNNIISIIIILIGVLGMCTIAFLLIKPKVNK